MDIKQRQLVNKYLDLFFRRKIFIFAVLLLSLPIGLGIYLTTPKEYQSSSLLSYQRQGISPNKLSPDLESKLRDIVNTLSQVVTSRTNLEKIINDLDLYPEERKILPIEDVIELFRKKIEVIPSRQGEVFTVSYSGGDPDKVVKATNAIATKFIEENLKYRQEKATDTSTYTSQELESAKKVMDAQENAMRDYKLQNYDEMPEHREANISRLTALQNQYQKKQESIQDLEKTLVLIQDQMNNRRMLIQQSAGPVGDGNVPDNKMSLASLRSTLDALSLKYTDKHPEVIRIRKLIEKMEKEGGTGKNSQSTGSAAAQAKTYDPVLLQLETQQKGVRLNIASLENEKNQLNKLIGQYEKFVAAAPTREAEWSSLTREYGQLKKHYDNLVTQNLQAESMLSLEQQQRGSQFKIEDSARSSGKPIKPDFLKIMAMTVMAGLGFGIAATLVLDFFDASFRDPETLKPTLGIPLLITIPYIDTRAELKRKSVNAVFVGSVFLLGGGVIVTLFVLAWLRGLIIV